MRSPAVLLAVFVLLSCSGASPPPARDADDATALPAVREEPGGGAMAVAMAPAGDATLCASLDLASFDDWLGTLAQRLPADFVELLDREFGGLVSELRRGAPLQVLGLDTSRQATLLVAPLDPSLEPAVDALVSIAASVREGQPLPAADALRFQALAEQVAASGLWVRVSLPVDGAPRLLDLVRQAVGPDARPGPPGFDLVAGDDEGPAVALWRDGSALVIDAWIPFGRGAGAVARVVQLRERPFTWPAWAPAPTAGASTAALRPAPLARLGFAHGVSQVRGALSAVDPSYQVAISSAGLREAYRAIELAGGVRGLAFDRVVSRVHADATAPGGEMVAEVRSGAVLDPGAAVTGPSLTAAGVAMVADVAPAALARLPLPGTDGATEPGRVFGRVVEEAGAWGFALALPYALQLAGNLLLEDAVEQMPAGRFERAGVLRAQPDGDAETTFGILPAGTTAAQARCALAVANAACGRPALRPGAIVQSGDGGFAKLQRVGDRWVVFVSRQRDRLDLTGLALVSSGAPVRFTLDGAAFVRAVPDLAWTAPLVGRQWVLELQPTPSALRVVLRSSAATP